MYKAVYRQFNEPPHIYPGTIGSGRHFGEREERRSLLKRRKRGQEKKIFETMTLSYYIYGAKDYVVAH